MAFYLKPPYKGGPAISKAPGQPYTRAPPIFPEWNPQGPDRPIGHPSTWPRPTYIKPDNHRETFAIGDVINRPYHVPNRDSTIQPGDQQIRVTYLNNFHKLDKKVLKTWVFTKPRMFIVLFKFKFSLFCLPIGSQTDEGMIGVPDWRREEMMQVRDRMLRDSFKQIGENDAIDFIHDSQNVADALSPKTMIDLANGTNMTWHEEALWRVGRITEKGYNRLLKQWKTLVDEATSEGGSWPPDNDGWQTPTLFKDDDFPALGKR